MPKKIAYLLGAGATEAVVKNLSSVNGLMTSDIRQHIAKTYSSKPFSTRVWNEIVSDGYDLEHIVSVLEYQYNYSASNTLRNYYRNAIVELSKNIFKKSSINPPYNLYSVLIDMHLNLDAKLDEELLCLMSLNYEDILENTIKKHFKYEVDYGIHNNTSSIAARQVSVFKLHGSFNWENVRPIQVAKTMTALSPNNTLWIPPGVDKKKENYPFNLLWGKAIEMIMSCDVLRVIGCSLSRNDWGLIPMLYTIQKFNTDGKKITIEIIDYPKTAETIKKSYQYLNIRSIMEIDEFYSFYERQFPGAPKDVILEEIKHQVVHPANPLQLWLEAKIEHLTSQLIGIKTPSDIVKNFYFKTA